jgi:protein-S-isoprenylcysteine O-methyltransferase Ste14
LKVPPPIVAALLAAAMWACALWGPVFDAGQAVRAAAALAVAAAGLILDVAGIVSFLRARTTVNPLKPGSTSNLVCSGIYRYTRNPMYLGLLLLLCAWAIYLGALLALLGPVVLVLYLNRFQIAPEERVLLERFGLEYAHYRARVRRWL